MPFRLVCMFGLSLWILIVPSFGGSLSVCDQISLNLVQNCGFEAPDLTGWTLVGNNDDGNSRLYRFDTNSGSYDYAMGNYPVEGLAGVSQLLTDTSGAAYNLTFWEMNSGDENAEYRCGADVPCDRFQVFWNDNLLLNLADQSGAAWASFSYYVTGTGMDTLTFEGYSLNGFDNVDDIALQIQSGGQSPSLIAESSAPEASTMSLIIPVLVAAVIFDRRRK